MLPKPLKKNDKIKKKHNKDLKKIISHEPKFIKQKLFDDLLTKIHHKLTDHFKEEETINFLENIGIIFLNLSETIKCVKSVNKCNPDFRSLFKVI